MGTWDDRSSLSSENHRLSFMKSTIQRVSFSRLSHSSKKSVGSTSVPSGSTNQSNARSSVLQTSESMEAPRKRSLADMFDFPEVDNKEIVAVARNQRTSTF